MQKRLVIAAVVSPLAAPASVWVLEMAMHPSYALFMYFPAIMTIGALLAYPAFLVLGLPGLWLLKKFNRFSARWIILLAAICGGLFMMFHRLWAEAHGQRFGGPLWSACLMTTLAGASAGICFSLLAFGMSNNNSINRSNFRG